MKFQILVCDGPSCGVMHDSDRLVDCIQAKLSEDAVLKERVVVERFTCFDHCDDGPNMFVRKLEPGEDVSGEPDSDVFRSQRGFYDHMNEQKVLRVLQEHCTTGEPVEDLVGEY